MPVQNALNAVVLCYVFLTMIYAVPNGDTHPQTGVIHKETRNWFQGGTGAAGPFGGIGTGGGTNGNTVKFYRLPAPTEAGVTIPPVGNMATCCKFICGVGNATNCNPTGTMASDACLDGSTPAPGMPCKHLTPACLAASMSALGAACHQLINDCKAAAPMQICPKP